MLKKGLLILAVLALVATGAFAQIQMSYGGGVLFDLSYGNGVTYDGVDIGWMHNNSFGIYGFFDATYAEVDVYFSYGIGTYGLDYTVIPGLSSGKQELDMNISQIGFAFLGKFPINLGAFTLFPCIGIGYNMVISLEYGNTSYTNAGEFSQWGILGGVGIDFPLSEAMFFRGQALFQVRLPSEYAKKGITSPYDTTMGFGPRIKLGVGFHL